MNIVTISILIFLVLQFIFKSWLQLVNLHHLRKNAASPPQKWRSRMDMLKLKQSVAYTSLNSFFQQIQLLISLLFALVLLYAGMLKLLVNMSLSLTIPPVLQGLALLYAGGAVSLIIALIFSFIQNFYIEKKFNFSTIKPITWIIDQIKSFFLLLIIGTIFAGGFLLLIEKAGSWWWILTWVLFNSIQLLISFLFPVIIAPLFYKFQPLEDEELSQKILKMAKNACFPVTGVFQIDASKRSHHTNAFFSGFGRSRRIALFDTLIKKHSHDEILAILAHEIGHWKKGHVIKGILFSAAYSAIGLFVVAALIDQPFLYDAFGLKNQYIITGIKGAIAGAGIILTGVLLAPVAFLMEPLTSWFSRKHEYQADAFSIELYPHPTAMEEGLIRLSEDNLSNLFPHPLYVLFHYSHPTPFQRIEALERRRSASGEATS